MSYVIGIDLGTTNSAVAILENGKPKIIKNPEGNPTTPSVVAYYDGKIQVGETAKRQALTNPETVLSIKEHMGESNYHVTLGNKEYTPQEISGIILKYIKSFAEDYVGEPILDAVITVPAYFNDGQRQATKDAGKIAGLNVKRIINEPTASSLAYGVDKDDKNEKILVYDLGGGTFDVSILELGNGIFQVLSTNGDTHLGGDDFDRAIMNYLIQDFKNQHQIDLSSDKMALQRLKEESEKAKKALSNAEIVHISIPFIATQNGMPIHLETDLNRHQFNILTQDLVEKTKIPFDKALSDANLTINDIDKVILNGGATRIPAIREAVAEWSEKQPDTSINPDEAVALGAAIQGGIISGNVKGMVLLDVTPLSLGVESAGGVFTKLIERNTTIPISKSQVFSTATDNQSAVDIHVLQGERPMASDNKTLGRFELDDIPPAPRGVPQIKVTFSIDQNGIVKVNAKDLSSGKEQKITIKATSALSDKEVKRMRQDAENHKGEDDKRVKLAELRNSADKLITKVTKEIAYINDKKALTEVQQIINALKLTMQNDDAQALQTNIDNLKATEIKLNIVNNEDSQSSKKTQKDSAIDFSEDIHNNSNKDESSHDGNIDFF